MTRSIARTNSRAVHATGWKNETARTAYGEVMGEAPIDPLLPRAARWTFGRDRRMLAVEQ